MSDKRVCLRVLLAVGVLSLMAIGGVMCQKQKSAEQEMPKVAVSSSMPPANSMMTDSSTIMAGSMGKSMVADSISNSPQTGYYTCPMHLQVHETKPGKCPVCGMSLVFKKAVTTAKTDKGTAIGRK
jgi:rubrerythrin